MKSFGRVNILTDVEVSIGPSWPEGVAAATKKKRVATLPPQTGWLFNINKVF
jgi:hypothetical protein